MFCPSTQLRAPVFSPEIPYISSTQYKLGLTLSKFKVGPLPHQWSSVPTFYLNINSPPIHKGGPLRSPYILQLLENASSLPSLFVAYILHIICILGWLFGLYLQAPSKVMSVLVSTCDSAHTYQLYSVTLLGDQVISTKI